MIPQTNFNGWGVQGNLTFDLTDDVQLVYIGSYRKYNSKFGQDQDGTPVPVACSSTTSSILTTRSARSSGSISKRPTA